MSSDLKSTSHGVMLNAYPDSIGRNLSDMIKMLKSPEFKDVFSLFYILPTFFNSDLDRGFSIIDYNLNNKLVTENDLKDLNDLNILLKFDIVLNHLSVASPQFKNLIQNGENSEFKDFFINWNEFWQGCGMENEEGVILPKEEFLNKLFMRKSGLPILKVHFSDGSIKPYWNTFYQETGYHQVGLDDLSEVKGLSDADVQIIGEKITEALKENNDLAGLDLSDFPKFQKDIHRIIQKKRYYSGQMDVNARSEMVWEFYEETLLKLKNYGCQILRLDAFAYLHKEPGKSNFFNKPGTWNYLERIKKMAQKQNLLVLPEIHAEYGLGLHDEVAAKGYHIYDFFLPGLMIHTIENRNGKALIKWVNEIVKKGYRTINMLGCHDGIPVLDLKGKEVDGFYRKGLLRDDEIEAVMDKIIERGGRVKNLYDPEGKKISYYQVNATFFSALGEDHQKLLLARAIQLFIPGIPQIWYLDIFAGKNDYKAADNADSGGHKEINRTNLSKEDIASGLKTNIVKDQIELMRLRNTSKAFEGDVTIDAVSENRINISWLFDGDFAHLSVNLSNYQFSIEYSKSGKTQRIVH